MTKKTACLIGVAAAGAVFAARKLRSTRPASKPIAGEVALITGGSRGLGLALGRELGRAGCRVAICARDKEELKSAIADLRSRGADAIGLACDVADQGDVEQLVSDVKQRLGRVDILVNNAGVIQVGPVQSFGKADFEEAMNICFWGTVYPTLAVLPDMLSRRAGRIVNISSIGGKVGVPHLLPYSSAKFAIAGFSQALAAEVRPQGVSVTAIYPGLLRTGSFVQAFFKGDQEKEAEWFTLGATLPGISMDPDRAARQIVSAMREGKAERTLSAPAKVISALNSVFPGGTSELLSLIASVALPGPRRSGSAKKGGALWDRMHPSVRVLGQLGLRAMQRYNQRA